MGKNFSLKEHRKAILVSMIIFLSLLYPVSAYSGYYIFTNSNNKINEAALETISPGLFTDTKGTQHAIVFSPHTPYGPIQDSSNVTLYAIDVNFTKIPPFKTYSTNSDPNGPFTYFGTLVQYNLTVNLTLKDNGYIVKQFSETITLNNKTTNLSSKKVFTWQPPAPSLLNLLNMSSQKTYTLQDSISETYQMVNSSHPNGYDIISGQGNIYLKWINTSAVFTISTTLVLFTALIIVSLYTGKEYKKYSKTKDSKTSFITYLKNKDFNFAKKKKEW